MLNEVIAGGLSGSKAASITGISLRHERRLLAAYRKEGVSGTGSWHQAAGPASGWSLYSNLNTQHFTELLSERKGINLSRSSVRRILLEAGIRSPRKRRPQSTAVAVSGIHKRGCCSR